MVMYSPLLLNSLDCKVFVFLKNRPMILCCGVRDEYWSEINYGEQLNGLDPRIKDDEGNPLEEGTLFFCKPVFCGGKIYAKLAVVDHIEKFETLSIEIVEEESDVGVTMSRIKSIRQGIDDRTFVCTEKVVESNGELFSLRFLIGGVDYRDSWKIEVRKMNFDTMRWEIVESIKDRSFFACRDYCLSCPISGPGQIYFTIAGDQSLYCYNLEEDSILVSLLPSYVAKTWFYPVWIMPEELVRPQEECRCNEAQNNDIVLMDTTDDCCNQGQNNHDIVLMDTTDDCGKELIPDLQIDVPSVLNWRTSLSASEAGLSSPFLMFPGKGQGLYNFLDPRTNQSYFMKIPEILKDTIIRFSNHGWLLMSRKKLVHLYNPVTGEVFVKKTSYEESFFLASKPTGSDCDHFVAVSFNSEDVEVDIYYPRTNRSSSHTLQTNKDFSNTYDVPVFFENAFYFIDSAGCLGELQIEEENCSWDVLDPPKKTCDSFRQIFLVECDGELLSVFIGSAGKYVLVYKLNGSKTDWEIITSLGNYNLYLSRCSSFSVLASPGEGNKIYFTRLRDCGVVFYSLDTSKWHSVGSEDSSNNFYDTKLMLNACWINPVRA